MYQLSCSAALRKALALFVLQITFSELLKGSFRSVKLEILAIHLEKQYSKHAGDI